VSAKSTAFCTTTSPPWTSTVLAGPLQESLAFAGQALAQFATWGTCIGSGCGTLSMPFLSLVGVSASATIRSGEAGLLGFASPESASEREFNSRVETLQTAFEFKRARLTRVSGGGPG